MKSGELRAIVVVSCRTFDVGDQARCPRHHASAQPNSFTPLVFVQQKMRQRERTTRKQHHSDAGSTFQTSGRVVMKTTMRNAVRRGRRRPDHEFRFFCRGARCEANGKNGRGRDINADGETGLVTISELFRPLGALRTTSRNESVHLHDVTNDG